MTQKVVENIRVKMNSSARKTSNPSIAERKKAAGQEKMSDILFEKYEAIRELQKKLNLREAEGKYDIGVLVAEVIKLENAYGARSVEKLTEALRHHHSTLRNYASVADTWEPDDFKALMKRKGKRGLPISFSHLVQISKIGDPAERDEWVDRVLNEGLSVRDLKKRWADEMDEVPAMGDEQVSDNGTGDTAEVEDDHADQDVVDEKAETAAVSAVMVRRSIARLGSDVKAIPIQAPEWDACVFKPLEADPDSFDDAVMDELKQISASNKAAIKTLQARDKQIDDLLKRARQTKNSARVGSVKEGGERNG